MKLKSPEITPCQGQILEVFHTASSGSSGEEEGANGWHYPVTRSQMGGWNKSIGDPEGPTQGLNTDGRASFILFIITTQVSHFKYITS